MRRRLAIAALATLALTGCEKPKYDTSSPQAALDSMRKMIADGRPEMLAGMLYIEPRDITYADGVTEASAINDVTTKTGDMLGRLFRVAGKLRDKFPGQIATAITEAAPGGAKDDVRPETAWARFMIDPFGLLDEQAARLSVEDLGDGTAAVLIDSKPALGFGLTMRDIDSPRGRGWKIDVPIELLQDYRPNTREEWSVVASLLLSMENALIAFENELDEGQFRDLSHASQRAGRLLGERVAVQALIYSNMKKTPGSEGAPGGATRPSTS